MPSSSSCGCCCGRGEGGCTLVPVEEIPANWVLSACTRCASGSPCEVLIAPEKKFLDLLVRVRASGRALCSEDLQNLQNVRGFCGECKEVCSHRRNKARREQAVVSRPRGKSGARTSYIKTTRVLFFWRV